MGRSESAASRGTGPASLWITTEFALLLLLPVEGRAGLRGVIGGAAAGIAGAANGEIGVSTAAVPAEPDGTEGGAAPGGRFIVKRPFSLRRDGIMGTGGISAEGL